MFRDVLISPFSALLDIPMGETDHRGGPHWPDWGSQTIARHNRGGARVDVAPAAETEVRPRRGPLAWGGAISQQFGHQIADFSMRVVPTLQAAPDATVAFGTLPRWKWHTFGDTPRFFQDILAWLGLPPERFILIDQPTRVERLFVLPQAEQLYGPGPSEEHLDRMDEIVHERLPHRGGLRGQVYVSRTGVHAYFAGESYLEQAMAAVGFDIIRPETLSLSEQLSTYAAAGRLIFGEGSALHALQLLGRSVGDVTVLVRRSGVHRRSGAHIAEHSLRARTRSLRYVEPTTGIICGMRDTGRRVEPTGMPILDENGLLDDLSDVRGLRDTWDTKAYAAARDTDILGWMARTLEFAPLRNRESWEHMLTTLREFGLGYLEGPARTLMSRHPESPLSAGTVRGSTA